MNPLVAAERALQLSLALASASGDPSAVEDLQMALGLVLKVGGWQLFPAAPAAPSSSTKAKSAAAIRAENYRKRKRDGERDASHENVTPGVTATVTKRDGERDASAVHASSLSSSESKIAEEKEANTEAEGEENARGERSVTASVTPAASRVTSRGARIRDDYSPRPETVTALVAEGFPNPLQSLPSFRDYWTAKPGKDGCKLDWDATFRLWVRREKTMTPATSRGRSVQSDNHKDWGFQT